jgi:hypothetical protein
MTAGAGKVTSWVLLLTKAMLIAKARKSREACLQTVCNNARPPDRTQYTALTFWEH